jgi:hypothetical protein
MLVDADILSDPAHPMGVRDKLTCVQRSVDTTNSNPRLAKRKGEGAYFRRKSN